MITIDLELLQNPNFPSLEILESRTKTVLENFNRCRKLNIKLHIKNDRIEEFCRLFNSITDRRALESLRLSMYAEDVDIYIKLLSEENTSVGVILETLSSLLDAAQERHETTKKLKEDYNEFFKNFNNEFANIEIHLTSDPSDPLLDNRHTSATRESAPSRTALIRTGNSADNSVIKYIPLLVACGTFVYTFYKPPLNLNLGYVFVPLFIFKKFLSKKYQDVQNVVTTKDSQEKLQNSEIVITDSDNNSFKDDRNKESSKNFIDSVLNEVEKETVFNTKNDVDRSTNVGITPTLTVNTVPTKNVQSSENFIDNILDEIENSLKEGYSIPNTNYEDEGYYESVDRLTNVDTPPTPTPPTPTPTPTPNVGTIPSPVVTTPIPNVGAAPNSLINRLLTASIFGILVYCSIRKAQRLWNYFMNKNKPKLRNMLYEQQREKYAKILDIKEKLPVIIQNIEILDQFWDNQIINIKSHVETLKFVDENEKIRFPQQIAALIKENWNKQYSESKANYNRMKELVTINSLLSPD